MPFEPHKDFSCFLASFSCVLRLPNWERKALKSPASGGEESADLPPPLTPHRLGHFRDDRLCGCAHVLSKEARLVRGFRRRLNHENFTIERL
jgi:hypothetical protein